MSIVRLLPGCGGFIAPSSNGAARPVPGGGFVVESGFVDTTVKDLSGNASAEAVATAKLREIAALSGSATAGASATAALLINGIFAEDGFAYADNINLADASSAMWAKTAWMGTKSIGVQGQKLYGSELGANAIYAHSTTPPSPDYSVSLDITAGVANLGSSHVAVVGRETEDFYGVEYVSGGFELFKYRYFYGKTLYGSYAFPLAAGASVNVRLEMIGGDIAVYLDNSPTPVLTYTDATPIATIGKAGIYAYTTALADWSADNFKAELASTGAVSVDLSGAAVATPISTGGLKLSVPLSGSAVAQALSAAETTVLKSLTNEVSLSGDAVSGASTLGTVSLNVSLSGAAVVNALATAALSQGSGVDLSGAAIANPEVVGALLQAVSLSGAAVVVTSVSGGLSYRIPLSGSGSSSTLVAGGLDVQVGLSGSALSEALADAGISKTSTLDGSAIADATGGATVALEIDISGDALASALAVGGLTISRLILVPSSVLIRIQRENRTSEVKREDRAMQVRRQNRTLRLSM